MRLRAATILLLLFACNRNPVQELKRVARRARPAGPEVHATVVTLRTIMQPSNKMTTTSIVIAV